MRKKISDTDRLKAVIDLWESGNSDFEQILFFARRERRTELAAFRLALDRWIKEREDDY